MCVVVMIIRIEQLGVTMGNQPEMTAIRVRRYDVERLKEFSMNGESFWETLARILNEHQHTQLDEAVE